MVWIRNESIGGLAAGVTGTIIGYPLDLIKTRMQTTAGATGSNMLFVLYGVIRRGKPSCPEYHVDSFDARF
jgi:hypothetical protein